MTVTEDSLGTDSFVCGSSGSPYGASGSEGKGPHYCTLGQASCSVFSDAPHRGEKGIVGTSFQSVESRNLGSLLCWPYGV